MGTRAIITIEKKPFVAIHWDGYPNSLGQELVNAYPTTKDGIIKVAQNHDIDYIETSYLDKLNKERIEKIAFRNDLTIEQVKNGKRRTIQTNIDHLIRDIANYPDWCEYQYNLNKDKEWEVTYYDDPPWHGTLHKFCNLKKYLKWKDLLYTLDNILYIFKKILKKRKETAHIKEFLHEEDETNE